jgi:hypothetical protein
MKNITHMSEALGQVKVDDRLCRIIATALAGFVGTNFTLIVHLDCLLRPLDGKRMPCEPRPDWMPEAETVTEVVLPEEALPAAKDNFASWVRRLREAISASNKPNHGDPHDPEIHH